MSRFAYKAVPTRNRLLSSCAIAAIAAITWQAPVQAQVDTSTGFQGTVTSQNGATVLAPVPGSMNTTVVVDNQRAIVDWNQTDPSIAFLPENHTANFVNNAELVSNYIILNRIVPADNSRAIRFEGTVNSSINGAQGGEVWFYSPSGILVGATGRFNVGSLLLTANNLDMADETFVNGTGTTFTFSRDTSNASVTIANGAEIHALGSSAYVALIAPRVTQSGLVEVNGTAAYVAAEKVEMTISNNLFDFAVDVQQGSDAQEGDDGKTLVHDGETQLVDNDSEIGYGGQLVRGGPRHAIMVAVPKNDAVTMLLTGAVGYTPAAIGEVADGRIVLSAGYDVRNGLPTNAQPDATKTADIRIENGSFFPSVFGQATGSATVTASASENAVDLQFTRSVSLTAGGSASLVANSGAVLDVDGSVALRVDAFGGDTDTGAGGSIVSPGVVEIFANGGTIDIAGSPSLFGEAQGGGGSTTGGDATGGLARIEALGGGTILIGGSPTLSTSADGGSGNEAGGKGTGGTSRIAAGEGSSVTITGSPNLRANGFGGFGDTAGDGTGGTVELVSSGGILTIGGSPSLEARGFGGSNFGDTGGNGMGGTGRIEASSGGRVEVRGSARVDVTGFGGEGGVAGHGKGGIIEVLAAGGDFIHLGSMSLIAEGYGGRADFGDGESGDGTGGSVTVATASALVSGETVAGNIDHRGSLQIRAGGFGGNSNNFGCQFCELTFAAAVAPVDTGTGGAGQGGAVDLAVASGSFETFLLDIDARGVGGDGNDGSDGSPGTGGTATLNFSGGSSDIQILSIDASGAGGQGGFGSFSETGPGGSGGRGGAGQGGGIALTVSPGALLELGQASLIASGEGGEGGFGRFGSTGGAGGGGGDGSGGTIDLLVDGGTLDLFSGEGGRLRLEVEGDGGDGGSGGSGSDIGDTGGIGGKGGLARGGTASLRVTAGSALVDDVDIDVDADGGNGGFGGSGGFDPQTETSISARGGDGGNAEAGTGLVEVTGGALRAGDVERLADIEINADAEGGEGNGAGALGGDGLGGSATIRAAAGGTIDISDDVFLDAAARGGEDGVRAGNAQGGSALIEAAGDGSAISIGGSTELLAIGGEEFGSSCCGQPDVGGDGTGGTAAIAATGGAEIDFGDDVEVLAFGRGGDGVQGGDGFGGTATILSSGSDIDIAGSLLVGAQSYGGGADSSDGGYGNGGGGGLARLDIDSGGRIGVGTGEGGGEVTLDVSGLGGEAVDDGEECIECSFEFAALSFGSESSGTSFAIAAASTGSGGDGQGGTAVAAIDGVLDTSDLTLDARGIGGSGSLTEAMGGGGHGRGGSATVDFSGGTNSLDSLTIDASGEGGFGGGFFGSESLVGRAGGSGAGGTVTLRASGGAATIADVEIEARGRGGDGERSAGFAPGGIGGAGGDGTGGTILVDAATGGILTLPASEFDASGRGGDGGDGRSGNSGETGGTGGAGGNGIGGTVELRTSGGSLTVRSVETFEDGYGTTFTNVIGPALEAKGVGGDGGSGGSDETGYGGAGGAAGKGGDGAGGIALMNAVAGTLIAGPAEFSASGVGGGGGSVGSGGPGFDGGAGGIGGNGRGGTAELRTGGGILTTFGEDRVESSSGTSSTVRGPDLDAQGVGGRGGDGGFDGFGGFPASAGVGGDGTGGTALANVAGGTLTAGPANFLASGFGADGSVGGLGTGGVAEILVDDGAGGLAGSATFGDTGMFASGVGPTGIETSGTVAIRESAAAPAGSLTLESLEVEVTGSNSPSHIGFLLTTGSGPIRITGDFTVDVDQNASFAGFDGGSVAVGGNLLVNAGVSISLEQTATGRGLALLNANDVRLTAGEGFGGGIFGATGGITSTIDITLRAEGDIALGFAQAGDDVDALSSGGSVAIGTAITTGLGEDVTEIGDGETGSGDGSNIVIDAAGAIRLDNGDAEDRIILTARGGRIDSAGLLTAVQLDATAATDIALTDVDVVNTLALATPNGAVSGRNFVSDNDIIIAARDGITLAGADAGRFVDLSTSAGDIAAGTLVAGTDIEASASGGTLALAGGTAGRDILLGASGDIAAGMLVAGTDIKANASGGTLALASGIAGRDILLGASGDIEVTSARAGDDFVATSTGGSVAAGTVVTTGLGEDGTLAASGPEGSNIVIAANGEARLDNGDAPDTIQLTSLTDSVVSAGLLRARNLLVEAAADVALNDLAITDNIDLLAENGTISGRNFQTEQSISLDARSIDVASLDAGTFIDVRSDTALTLGTAEAGTDISLAAEGGDLLGTTLDAGGSISASARDLVAIDRATAGADLALNGAAVTLGSGIAAGDINIGATGTVAVGSAEAGDAIEIAAGGAIEADALSAGGDILLRSENGAVVVSDLEADAVDASGTAVSLASTGALAVRSATATAGDVLLTSGGALTVGAARASGDIVGRGARIDIASADASGLLDLAAANEVRIGRADVGRLAVTGTSIAAETLRVDASIVLAADGGDISIGSAESGQFIDLSASEGDIAATRLAAPASIALAAGGTIALANATTGGSLIAASGGTATLGAINAGSDIAVSGGGVTLANGTAGRDIALQSPGAISVGAAQAGDDFIAEAGTSFAGTTIATTGAGEDDIEAGGSAGSNILVDAGAIALDTGDAHDAMRLTSAGGSVASSASLAAGTTLAVQAATTIDIDEAQAGGAIDLGAGGAITANALRAGTDVLLASEGGAILVASDLQAGGSVDASGTAVTLNAVGPLSVRSASASAGDVTLASGGDLTIQTAQASGNVAATSGATLALNGEIDGAQISFTSGDIAVGQGARVGTAAGTNTVAITANNGSVVIGGSGGGTGYRLDNAEFARFAARDVGIRALGTTGVQIDSLTVRGSAASSPNVTGRLSIESGGDVDMIGTLSVENADAGNSVGITAANAFYADTAGGGIAIADGSGGLTGSVDVTAASITVASQSAVADLAGADTIAERDARLGLNDGTDNPAGFIRAGAIRLAASERIHVQNSGLNGPAAGGGNPLDTGADNRAGLTAGSGGITLVTLGQAPVEIIINGRQENGSGGFITGGSLIPELNLQNGQGGEANIAAGSTVNGCLIFGASCGVQLRPTVVVQDLLEDLLDESDDSLTRPPLIAFSQLISIEGSPLLPVIEDPVTGIGNEAAWSPPGAPGLECDDERQDCVVDQPVTGSGNEELQRGTSDSAPSMSIERRPNDSAVDAPVTGTGNEDLQNDDGEDEG